MFGLRNKGAGGSVQIVILVELSFVIFIMLSGISVLLACVKTFDQFLLQQQSFYLAQGGIEIGNKILEGQIRDFDQRARMMLDGEDAKNARYKMYNLLRAELESMDRRIESEDGFVLEIELGVERVYLGYAHLKMQVKAVGTVEGVRSEIVQDWEYEYVRRVEDEDGGVSFQGGGMDKRNWDRRR